MAEENNIITVDYIVCNTTYAKGPAKTITAEDGTVYSGTNTSYSLNYALSNGNNVVLDSYEYSAASANSFNSNSKTLTGTGNSVITNMTASAFSINGTNANGGSLKVEKNYIPQ